MDKIIKDRNSSIELLRIILILMVFVEHANMWYVGGGYTTATEHFVRCFVQTVCVPAVNAFVLISGWFGVKGDYKRIFPLLFQLAVCTVPFAIYFALMGKVFLFSLDSIFEYLFGGANYWFVTDYIVLVLVAPLLNVAVESVEQKTLKTILIFTYLLIVPFDVVFRSSVLGIEGGYSALWFMWLYLFARYVRIYGWSLVDKYKWWILVGCIALQSVLFYMELIGTRYTNPFVLMPAICLVLIFRNFSFHNKVINYIAPATLVAYMLHMQPCLVPYIREFLSGLYKADGYYVYVVKVMGLIFILYVVSIIIYRLQAFVWKSCFQKLL